MAESKERVVIRRTNMLLQAVEEEDAKAKAALTRYTVLAGVDADKATEAFTEVMDAIRMRDAALKDAQLLLSQV